MRPMTPSRIRLVTGDVLAGQASAHQELSVHHAARRHVNAVLRAYELIEGKVR